MKIEVQLCSNWIQNCSIVFTLNTIDTFEMDSHREAWKMKYSFLNRNDRFKSRFENWISIVPKLNTKVFNSVQIEHNWHYWHFWIWFWNIELKKDPISTIENWTSIVLKLNSIVFNSVQIEHYWHYWHLWTWL